ncbi:MAG TPA: hypothetical protein GXX70_03250 [Tepidimicrobium sp.]|nr:hypothetical protein [Tepidimicrobium sp.]
MDSGPLCNMRVKNSKSDVNRNDRETLVINSCSGFPKEDDKIGREKIGVFN